MKQTNNNRKLFLSVIIITIIITLVIIGFYVFNFKSHELSSKPTDWGTLGDYLSGTLGSVLSFMSFLMLLLTIYYQTKQQDITTKAFLVSERPWVSLEVEVGNNILTNQEGLDFEFKVHLKNLGKTPALNIELGIKLENAWLDFDFNRVNDFFRNAYEKKHIASAGLNIDAIFPNDTFEHVLKARLAFKDLIERHNKLLKENKDYSENHLCLIYADVFVYAKYKSPLDDKWHMTRIYRIVQADTGEGAKGLALQLDIVNLRLVNSDKCLITTMPFYDESFGNNPVI